MAFLDEAEEESVGGRPLPGRGIGRVLRGPDQAVPVGIGSEVVVHVVERGRVPPARGGGLEDRVQKESGDAEALDVVEPLQDSLQVSAETAHGGDLVEAVPGGCSQGWSLYQSAVRETRASRAAGHEGQRLPRGSASFGSLCGSPFRKRSGWITYQTASCAQAGGPVRRGGGPWAKASSQDQTRARPRQAKRREVPTAAGSVRPSLGCVKVTSGPGALQGFDAALQCLEPRTVGLAVELCPPPAPQPPSMWRPLPSASRPPP